jgi:hypothetical protein
MLRLTWVLKTSDYSSLLPRVLGLERLVLSLTLALVLEALSLRLVCRALTELTLLYVHMLLLWHDSTLTVLSVVVAWRTMRVLRCWRALHIGCLRRLLGKIAVLSGVPRWAGMIRLRVERVLGCMHG